MVVVVVVVVPPLGGIMDPIFGRAEPTSPFLGATRGGGRFSHFSLVRGGVEAGCCKTKRDRFEGRHA